MQIPKHAQHEPLTTYINAQQLVDAEMTTILRNASRESVQIINFYGAGIGSKVRQAQLDLAKAQLQTWQTVGAQTHVAIGDGVDAASDSTSFLTDLIIDQTDDTTNPVASYIREALLQQARQGIFNLLSRRINGFSLAERIYKNAVISSGQMDNMLDGLIVNGASAREIAKRTAGFFNPDVSGGVGNAAMRLGRNELNNAFHETSRRLHAQQPWIVGMKWNLSGSHPKPDACNDYADTDHADLGRGVFDKNSVPNKPHVNCLCFITPETPSREEFVQSFKNGEYDSYINGIGCTGHA